MPVNLTFLDLSLWLATNAIILVMTSEILVRMLHTNVINKKRMRVVVIIIFSAFLTTVLIRFYETYTSLEVLH